MYSLEVVNHVRMFWVVGPGGEIRTGNDWRNNETQENNKQEEIKYRKSNDSLPTEFRLF